MTEIDEFLPPIVAALATAKSETMVGIADEISSVVYREIAQVGEPEDFPLPEFNAAYLLAAVSNIASMIEPHELLTAGAQIGAWVENFLANYEPRS